MFEQVLGCCYGIGDLLLCSLILIKDDQVRLSILVACFHPASSCLNQI